MKRVVAGLLAIAVAGCVAAPNLDKAVAGGSATSIRGHIVAHKNWGEKLTSEELDQLADFIAAYAGQDSAAHQRDPGLTIWKANGCGSCHVLAAAGDDER